MTDALALGAGDAALAIVTAATSLTFAAGRRQLRRPPPSIVATPSIETILAIWAALAHDQPLALLHPRASAAELDRQRALVDASGVPPALVLFTSGSTGAPRGVVLGRTALLAAAEASAAHLGWRDDDRWLLALSTAHAGGLAIVIRCLAARRPIVLLDRDFDPAAVAALLDQCTLASLVPAQLAALLDDPAWRPPPRLRAVLLGGAAAPVSLLAAAAARGVPVLATYGMTETLGQLATVVLARAGDPTAPLVALPGVELEAGTHDRPAPIRVRGPMLASHYLDGAPIAPCFATADLGYLEGDALQVVGRADDVVISGAEHVHPAIVEAALVATPGVVDACVAGVADARWGAVIGAAIVVTDRFARREALGHWHAVLPPHARPRRLAIVDALPRLPSGKVDRRAIAALLAAGADAIAYAA